MCSAVNVYLVSFWDMMLICCIMHKIQDPIQPSNTGCKGVVHHHFSPAGLCIGFVDDRVYLALTWAQNILYKGKIEQ